MIQTDIVALTVKPLGTTSSWVARKVTSLLQLPPNRVAIITSTTKTSRDRQRRLRENITHRRYPT